jgi:hypothetical protein
MKIRELFENTTLVADQNVPHVWTQFGIDFELLPPDTYYYEPSKKKFKKELLEQLLSDNIEEETGRKPLSILIDQLIIRVKIPVLNAEQAKDQSLLNLLRQVHRATCKTLEMNGHDENQVQKPNDLQVVYPTPFKPGITFDWPKVTIMCQDGSLKDIHKHVKCSILNIGSAKNVKSNALGILKIKDLSVIYEMGAKISARPNEQPYLWLKIIDQHLHGDKNVLACQEALIDNDLKDYAEL